MECLVFQPEVDWATYDVYMHYSIHESCSEAVECLSCQRGKGFDPGRKHDEFPSVHFDRSSASWARDSKLTLGRDPVVYNGIQFLQAANESVISEYGSVIWWHLVDKCYHQRKEVGGRLEAVVRTLRGK